MPQNNPSSILPEILPEEAKAGLFVPISKSAGQTLADIWDLVFGGFGTYVEKKRLSRAKDLEAFKQSLDNRVLAIPEEHLCEPKLSILGPAMEASKYYYEEPEIREMFASLMAASMDSTKAQFVHPSFTEIIKQMSPLDAQNLACFHDGVLPVVEYHLTSSDGGYFLLASNVFLANKNVDDLTIQAQSLSALKTLGLVSIAYDLSLTAPHSYDKFDETQMYLSYKEQLSNDEKNVTIKKGVTDLTPLGRAFKRICLD